MPSSAPRSRLLNLYYPSLDGLRAVAILLVFAIHFGEPIWHWSILRWGWLGVDVFFVLSGFLITGILYDSVDRADYFRNFYIRRVLRIFPLWYGFWIVVLLVGLTPWFHVLWNRYVVAMAAYVGNFFIPGGLLGHHPSPSAITYQQIGGHTRQISLGAFWSLCVEEQFYFIWPAIIWWVRSRRKLLWICVVFIVFDPILRALYLYSHPYMLRVQGVYSNSFFRADTLLVGAAIAIWLRGANPSTTLVRKCSYAVVAGAFSVLLLAMEIERHIVGHGQFPHLTEDPVIVTIGFTLVALAAAGLLLLTIDNESLIARILKNRVLLWLGRISYGLYVIHGPISNIIVNKSQTHGKHIAFLFPLIGVSISIALAWLSFQLIESPFLKLKSKLAPRPGAADDPPPYLQTQHVELPAP